MQSLKKKSLVVATIMGTVGSGLLLTGAVVSAESGTDKTSNPMSSLVDKLASTFNLDKTKVQAVFDTQRTEMEAKHEQEVTAKLDSLVSAGTITPAQRTAIQTKLAALKKEREANKDSMKGLSDTERKAKMDAERTALQTWATEQGLDLTKLQGVFSGGHHGGFGGPR